MGHGKLIFFKEHFQQPTARKMVSKVRLRLKPFPQTATIFMIWQEMSGNGVRITISPAIIHKIARIQKDLLRLTIPKNPGKLNACNEGDHFCAMINTVSDTKRGLVAKGK